MDKVLVENLLNKLDADLDTLNKKLSYLEKEAASIMFQCEIILSKPDSSSQNQSPSLQINNHPSRVQSSSEGLQEYCATFFYKKVLNLFQTKRKKPS